MEYTFTPTGVCSTKYHAEVGKDGVIESLSIENGCPGNLEGICRLVKGMHIDEVAASLEGVRCGHRHTSCPDQIAKMMKEIKATLPA